MKNIWLFIFCTCSISVFAQTTALKSLAAKKADSLFSQTVAWRRDFHQNPELGNREVRTAGIVANYLRSLGLEVKTGVATTGVVALLKGAYPGPVVALRSEIDGLPVTEHPHVPFASTITTNYNGQTVGTMHACGHDTHMAMLLTVAEILTSILNNAYEDATFHTRWSESLEILTHQGTNSLKKTLTRVTPNQHLNLLSQRHPSEVFFLIQIKRVHTMK